MSTGLKSSSTIAAFSTKTKEWKKMGNLKNAREGHGVSIQRGEFIVVGGKNSESNGQKALSTERCTVKGDVIKCTEIGPVLTSYEDYPEMMLVLHDYCPK